MNVIAIAVSGHPDWRWRIVDYNRETVEESYRSFPTIAEALAEGNQRAQRHIERAAPIPRRAK
jgi:hypothetical protein